MSAPEVATAWVALIPNTAESGALVIPADAVAKIPAAVDLLARRERVIIEASKQPGFSVERLR